MQRQLASHKFYGLYLFNYKIFICLVCKHRENRKKMAPEHLIGCLGFKLFLQKDVTITTVTTATVNTVTLTTVTILVFKFVTI